MSLDEAWLPTLLEVEYLKARGTEAERQYYSRFGWNNLVVSVECQHLIERWDYLGERFMGRYGARMLNAETMERWQVRLQNRLDEVQHVFERAYSLYAQYREDMDGDIIESETITGTSTAQASGTDSTTGDTTTKNIDTPDSVINASDDYADNLTKSASGGSTTYGRKDTMDTTTTREVHGKGVIENVNDSIDRFRDIDTEFIKAFENNFLNIFWY